MLHVLWYIIAGFVVGLIARAIMPGAQHMGLFATSLLGIAGSIVGGLITHIFKKPADDAKFHMAGFLMSLVGSLLLLFLWTRFAQ